MDDPNFEEIVSSIIVEDCKKDPVLILNDMVEQHYRKERIFTAGISTLDLRNMIKRKLDMAFPSYPVRGALALKEKILNSAGKSNSSLYIFAAVPLSDHLQKTIDAVRRSLANLVGFALLPIEISDMVKKLQDKTRQKGEAKAKWSLFIGQQQNGGLRQIVTKGDEIALTRITPLQAPGDDIQSWVQDVQQEFKSTMSYLSRLGFRNEEGLSITLVADPNAGEAFKASLGGGFQCKHMTAPQAASLLGVSVPDAVNAGYSDALHAAWIAKKPRLTLPLRAESLDKILIPRQIAMAASLLMVFSAGVLGYQSFESFAQATEMKEQITSQSMRLQRKKAEYKAELDKKKDLGFDIRLLQGVNAVADDLQRNNIPILHLLKGIGIQLGRELRADSINIRSAALEGGATAGRGGRQHSEVGTEPPFTLTLRIIYPPDADVVKLDQEISALSMRLANYFEPFGYVARVNKKLQDTSLIEELVLNAQKDVGKVGQDLIAEIIIEGAPET